MDNESLKKELEATRQELAALKEMIASQNPAEPEEIPLEALSPEEALQVFSANPVAFIQGVVNTSATKHLADLKDEAELNGALRAIRREKPEFSRFEPFILHEVAELIRNDPDGVIDPWQDLLEKGFEQFKKKFRETLEKNPEALEQKASGIPAEAAFVEGGASRAMPQEPPSFSRQQIAGMSAAEFLANEKAINEALKLNRIR